MKVRHVVFGLAALCACGHGNRPEGTRYLFTEIPTDLSGLTLELGGKTGTIHAQSVYVDVAKGTNLAAGTPVKLTFPTPCGSQAVTFPLGELADTAPGVREMRWPADIPGLVLTRIAFDPALAGTVQLGSRTFKRAASRDDEPDSLVFGASCLKTIKIDGVETPVPPPPASIEDGRNTLFITKRTAQCFLDQKLAYGDAAEAKEQRLEGGSVYWLYFGGYDFWFQDVPSLVTTSMNGATRKAMGLCS